MFQYEDDLKNHRKRDHTAGELLRAKMNLPNFKCPHCGKGHNTSEALRKHIARVCGLKLKIAKGSETVTEKEDSDSPKKREPER